MSTFAERLRNATSPGYDNSLRRSIQSVVLFEARRILSQIEAQRTAENLENLKAFQKKHVHWELANALLETTDLLPHQRAAVMWRTATSREPLGPETAWKRSKTIEKELKAICDSIRPLQADGRSHDEAIDEYILQTFVSTSTGTIYSFAFLNKYQFSLMCLFSAVNSFLFLSQHIPRGIGLVKTIE